jgi:AICAR transformylase/IMP cyclohydrolase PurH
MGNINTLAVAALADAACIILAEGSILDEAAQKKAKEKGITVLLTGLSIFDAALLIHQKLHA